MKINILHINANYIYSQLHKCMVEKLDLKGNTSNKVFVATYNKKLGIVKTDSDVIVCECFNKWDRLFFDYKQRKILKAVEENTDIRNFNCIHAYTLFTDGNCARNLSKKYNIPYVVAVRNTDVNSFFRIMKHLRKRGVKIMLDAKAVFFLSEAYLQEVLTKYVPKKYHDTIISKTQIIPNGIDDFWLHNAPEDNKTIDKTGTINLIYAGRIDKNKNIPTIQKAMEILSQKGYRFHLDVVGQNQDDKEYKKIQADKNTTCLAPMAKEQLIDVYRKADIFIMPSFTESFGLVYAEAMSQGLPIIYSKGQGFDGQFAEGTVGFSVDAYSPESVAEGIEKLINNYDAIAMQVVEKAKKFNWTKLAGVYDEIYKDIMK